MNLGELGEMYSSEEVRELRQWDRAEIEKLKVDKKMLEEKISELSRLAQPFVAKLFPGSLHLQSPELPAGNNSAGHFGMDLPGLWLFYNFSYYIYIVPAWLVHISWGRQISLVISIFPYRSGQTGWRPD